VRVVLLAHATTEATRRAGFADDEPLTDAGRDAAAAARLPSAAGRADLAVCGPARRCVATAAALGVPATPEPRLAGCDYGRWRGRSLDEVLAVEPDAVAAWLADPTARPHGGESHAALVERVGGWLDALADAAPRWVLAVADPGVVRAAIAHAVGSGAGSIRRFDLAPLGAAVLVGEPGRWSLRALLPAGEA
jgi:broad specificity phosphatase PhoE